MSISKMVEGAICAVKGSARHIGKSFIVVPALIGALQSCDVPDRELPFHKDKEEFFCDVGGFHVLDNIPFLSADTMNDFSHNLLTNLGIVVTCDIDTSESPEISHTISIPITTDSGTAYLKITDIFGGVKTKTAFTSEPSVRHDYNHGPYERHIECVLPLSNGQEMKIGQDNMITCPYGTDAAGIRKLQLPLTRKLDDIGAFISSF